MAGRKDSSGDWSNTANLIERFAEMCIFPGSERHLRQGLDNGGAGCITATANINAAGAHAVWDAWKDGAGDLDARDEALIAVRGAIEAYPVIPAQKFLLARHRHDAEWLHVRPPLLDLDERNGAVLLESLANLDFTLD
jgi:4-hydroxy-tetrahydrodipicolinate synthase